MPPPPTIAPMPAPRDRSVSLPARWWECVLAGLAFGLLTALSFPPIDIWPLTFLSIVPLIWIGAREGTGPLKAAVFTGLGVVPLWAFEEHWLIRVTELGYPLICVYLSAYGAIFVGLLLLVRRAPRAVPLAVAAPILWVALEFIRGEIALTGYAWFLLGQPVIHAPALAMPAGLFGSYFISFLVAALGGALGDASGWSRGARWKGGAAALAVVLLWVLTGFIGSAGHSADPARTINVGLVQTNVPQNNKKSWGIERRLEDWKRMAELTRQAAEARPRPDLIVLPETMFPGDALNPDAWPGLRLLAWPRKGATPPEVPGDHFILRLLELQQEVGLPMLVGAQALEGLRVTDGGGGRANKQVEAHYNSSFLVWKGAVQEERYDKIDLTPFGEVIPYAWRWPSLHKLVVNVGAGGMAFDLAFGSHLTVFQIPVKSEERAGADSAPPAPGLLETAPTPATVPVVTPICFEATKSDLCRRLVYSGGSRRAALLINMSNDGWFGNSDGWFGNGAGGREQHLLAARWRCVELGVPMVRSVNTGISCSIDCRGSIRRYGPEGKAGAVNVDGVVLDTVALPPMKGSTFFARFGNGFGWVVLVMAAALPVVVFRAPSRARANIMA